MLLGLVSAVALWPVAVRSALCVVGWLSGLHRQTSLTSAPGQDGR